MRIYYKKKFWAGVGALLLGLALPGTCLFVGWERFDLKDAVLKTFMVLSGISGILRSLDREKAREDKDEDRDERDRYNTCRSRANFAGSSSKSASKSNAIRCDFFKYSYSRSIRRRYLASTESYSFPAAGSAWKSWMKRYPVAVSSH